MSGPILATGFVVDQPSEGTIFPSAGGNSGDPRVQAVYWRCLTVLFASARIANPDLRLVLFSNVLPPVVDGHDLGEILAGHYGVELRRVPLTARLSKVLTPAWGNVLYFFDILGSLADEPEDTRFALVDSDVLVARTLAPLFGLLDTADYALYAVNSGDDENVNGLTPRQMGAIAASIREGMSPEPIPHFGGELFATTLGIWRRDAAVFEKLLHDAGSEQGPAAGVRTEEHIFSIAAAILGARVAEASEQIKRIWTSPRHSTVAPGDEALTLWHLPAEKRYGFRDLFGDLARAGFSANMDAEKFRAMAMARSGLPAKGVSKLVRDSIRQTGAKLGVWQ